MDLIHLRPRTRSRARRLQSASAQLFELTAGLVPGANSFACGGWVYPETLAEDGVVMATGGISTATGFRLRVRSNARLRVDLRDSAGHQLTSDDGDADVPLRRWSHVAMVQNRTTSMVSLFLNGVQTLTTSSATIGDINASTLKRIGAYSTTTSQMNGRIARVFYAQQLLDTDDLAALIAGAPRFVQLPAALQAKLAAFWDLDTAGAASDAVGSNDATETNGPIALAGGPS